MTSDLALFNHEAFQAALEQESSLLTAFRQALRSGNDQLSQRFSQGTSAAELVSQRAWLIDQLVIQAWRRLIPYPDLALIAVGGYGRGELHPHSDVDILILHPDDFPHTKLECLEHLLMLLWDIGLEVGHSVRSLTECITLAQADITIATNLMESRHLAGHEALFQQMRAATSPAQIWSSRDFFEAKLAEQLARHRKFNDTGYNLEPNIKEGPGGLRDIQMIGWVAKRHFNTATLYGLVEHHFLTENEYQDLTDGQNLLWKIRIALHYHAKRHEDRLLFDHQRTIARQFGYQDDEHSLAVEKFMKDYYRTVKDLSRLNEMLLQLFDEEMLPTQCKTKTVQINPRFRHVNGYLEACYPDVFRQHPPALLELFLLMEQHAHLKGVRAGTMRLVRQHRHLIDETFRADPECRRLFIDILSQNSGVTHELRRMHRYGVLGAYLPVFARIIGQMQHDLFHVYTVDEHSLSVLRNVRRFSVTEFAHEFPLCSTIFTHLKKPLLLYIAALFHDIAKGRGGDHSDLGAIEVGEFCRQHMLDEVDTALCQWLVKNHLLMSTTAQRKDLSDPEAINTFAITMGDQPRLDCLYLLTVADIRATSPTVWNTWKDALLKELYNAASRALRQGLEHPLRQEERIDHIKQQALDQLKLHRLGDKQIEPLWNQLGSDYFLIHSADEVAWQTRTICSKQGQDIIVQLRQQTKRGGTELFIYAPDQEYLFANITASIAQAGLNIADARVYTSGAGHTLDTFIVLEDDGQAIGSTARLREVQHIVEEALHHPERVSLTTPRRLSRQLRHFPTTTEVSFQDDSANHRTVMKVIASDRPGLLARIALALVDSGVQLKQAKISTLGEKAEDVFFITDHESRPLHQASQLNQLRDRVILQLAD